MPTIRIASEGNMTTRSQYSKVDSAVTLELKGNELPNTELLGRLLDEAVKTIQDGITESYKTVPARV